MPSYLGDVVCNVPVLTIKDRENGNIYYIRFVGMTECRDAARQLEAPAFASWMEEGEAAAAAAETKRLVACL